MAKPPGRIHSREVWEGYRELVYNLYLKQNWKSQEVTDFLNDNYSLAVTDRQVKNKIKDWKYNQKRTCAPFYRAMLVVSNHRRDINGLSTVFQVPKKDTRVEVPTKRIKKEVERQKELVDLPSIEEAERLLLAKGYTWGTPNPSNSTECPYSTLQDDVNFDIDRSEIWDWVTSDEEEDEPKNEPGAPTTAEHYQPYPPPHVTTGPTTTLPGTSSVDMESLTNLTESSLTITMNLQGPQHPIRMASSLPSNRNFVDLKGDFGGNTMFPTAYTIPPTLDYINHCRLCPSDHSHEDFDFGEAMDRLSLAGEQKMHVSQWAGPWFWHAFGSGLALPTSKSGAIDILKRLLREQPDNQYIFPCLSWMILILGSNGKHAELKEFLTASCAVIDEETNQNLLYSSIFHYALAVREKNTHDKRKYGENFARLHEPMKLVWRNDHPNVLVNLTFWAWYLLDEQRYAEAIELLEGALPSFERVMGRHDLLTINCRTILSRAYADRRNYPQAIYHLEQALQFMGNHRRELDAFSFELHGRLAVLKKDNGDFTSAEQHLRYCIQGRMQTFGLQDQYIWYFINLLCGLLGDTGRGRDIDQVLEELQQRPDCPVRELDELQARLRYYYGNRGNM